MTLETKLVGYYEMMRMNQQVLLFNKAFTGSSRLSLQNLFFNPNTPNKDIKDRKWTNYFWDYLVWWIILIVIVLTILLTVVLYYCRRETLKKYSGK